MAKNIIHLHSYLYDFIAKTDLLGKIWYICSKGKSAMGTNNGHYNYSSCLRQFILANEIDILDMAVHDMYNYVCVILCQGEKKKRKI